MRGQRSLWYLEIDSCSSRHCSMPGASSASVHQLTGAVMILRTDVIYVTRYLLSLDEPVCFTRLSHTAAHTLLQRLSDGGTRTHSAAAGLPAARVRIRFAGVAGEWDTGMRRARMAAGPLAGTWATRAELRAAHGASWDAARVLAVRALGVKVLYRQLLA